MTEDGVKVGSAEQIKDGIALILVDYKLKSKLRLHGFIYGEDGGNGAKLETIRTIKHERMWSGVLATGADEIRNI